MLYIIMRLIQFDVGNLNACSQRGRVAQVTYFIDNFTIARSHLAQFWKTWFKTYRRHAKRALVDHGNVSGSSLSAMGGLW